MTAYYQFGKPVPSEALDGITMDEHGNKVMDQMSREETLQAMKARLQYGNAVSAEFSGDGMAALAEGRKGCMMP